MITPCDYCDCVFTFFRENKEEVYTLLGVLQGDSAYMPHCVCSVMYRLLTPF